MGYSKITEDKCCFIGLHFTDQDICIQSLRPNHYEEHSTDESSKPLSEFVESIIGTRHPPGEEECKFMGDGEESHNFRNILRDITNDLKAEPKR